ncbi:PLAC8 family protein [Phytophthora infestans T30-4]|uniref:PLAC8 family protein n=2 Tax=Phytophthora infestans TaxID=4787 RepID=D0N9G6_PHYIT|nr:PLAC8 family protein [Phytophthora infestans T30-4]EEY54454.1 PLAC8 family protein [Phytophthora infestans T30-4]KAF4030065.1 PLAC8 family [Phytophthora infestans]KAF4136341.1 PLAC8 family [Phytophthora infestans]|eukprot:XP_002904276.1 PLAC8 family protein [Phytophthora infestans T30-4]
MSEPIIVETPKDTPRVAFAIQMDEKLGPHMVEPCTPEADNAYTKIGDDIVLGIATGYWTADFFACFDHLVPNALMATLCPCVSLAQITSRLGMVPYYTSLLFFALLCSFEVVAVTLTIQQFISVVILGHDVSYHYYHAHRLEDARPAVNAAFLSLAVVAHAAFAAALWVLRKRIRSQYQIPGSSANDCMAVTCCPCFSTAQMATHIKSYTPGSCTIGPVDTLPCYQ